MSFIPAWSLICSSNLSIVDFNVCLFAWASYRCIAVEKKLNDVHMYVQCYWWHEVIQLYALSCGIDPCMIMETNHHLHLYIKGLKDYKSSVFVHSWPMDLKLHCCVWINSLCCLKEVFLCEQVAILWLKVSFLFCFVVLGIHSNCLLPKSITSVYKTKSLPPMWPWAGFSFVFLPPCIISLSTFALNSWPALHSEQLKRKGSK